MCVACLETDEEQLLLAEDAGLEELLSLYKHQHPKVKGYANTALAHLTTNGTRLSPL